MHRKINELILIAIKFKSLIFYFFHFYFRSAVRFEKFHGSAHLHFLSGGGQ